MPTQRSATGRVWTDEEISAGLELLYERRGTRLYPYLREHVINCYNAQRKRLFIGGNGTISRRQLCQDLYVDGAARWRSARTSTRRHMSLLQEIGAIEVSTHTDAAGKYLGLVVAFLPVSEEVVALVRGCSSAG